MSKTEELTYDAAADYLDVSPRHVRRLLQKHGIKPIVHGYRTIRFNAEKIFRLKFKLATESNRHSHNGHGQTNGKGHR